jgi:hypothetical protein
MRKSFIKDPDLPWDGVFPYDQLRRRLREAGAPPIGPASTAQAVRDCLFDLMQAGPVDQLDRAAWDELRQTHRRLVADFFLYCLPEPDWDEFRGRLAELEVPVIYPDFRQLADLDPDYSRIPPPSPRAPDQPPGDYSPVTPGAGIDLGPVKGSLLRILGEADE